MSESSVVFKKFRFEADGRVYELERQNLATEGAYAAHLEEKLARGIARIRPALGEAAWRAAVADLNEKLYSEAFGWLTKEFITSLQGPRNTEKLLWLWFNQSYPEQVSEEQVHEWYRTRKADLDGLLGELLSDPNPSGPAPTGTKEQPGNPSPSSKPAPNSSGTPSTSGETRS